MFGTIAWYLLPVKDYEKNPSQLVDKMSLPDIFFQRDQACRFIEDIGHHLRLYQQSGMTKASLRLNLYCSPLRTIATAQLYFHIFFTKYSMKAFPPLDIALTSLLVASKAEETYKKIRQILSAAFIILNPQYRGSEIDVKIVEDHRKRAIQYEDILLEAIKFNFSVSHAYEDLVIFGHEKQSQAVMQRAFMIMRSLYRTSIILHFPPHYLALLAIVESRVREGLDVNGELKWASDHHINRVDLSEIMDRLEMVTQITGSASNK